MNDMVYVMAWRRVREGHEKKENPCYWLWSEDYSKVKTRIERDFSGGIFWSIIEPRFGYGRNAGGTAIEFEIIKCSYKDARRLYGGDFDFELRHVK